MHIVKKCVLYKLQYFYTLLFMNFEKVYIDVLKTFLKFKDNSRVAFKIYIIFITLDCKEQFLANFQKKGMVKTVSTIA